MPAGAALVPAQGYKFSYTGTVPAKECYVKAFSNDDCTGDDEGLIIKVGVCRSTNIGEVMGPSGTTFSAKSVKLICPCL